jgi:hypothetical protein
MTFFFKKNPIAFSSNISEIEKYPILVSRSPSRNHPLSPTALTLSPLVSSSATDEVIPMSLLVSLTIIYCTYILLY